MKVHIPSPSQGSPIAALHGPHASAGLSTPLTHTRATLAALGGAVRRDQVKDQRREKPLHSHCCTGRCFRMPTHGTASCGDGEGTVKNGRPIQSVGTATTHFTKSSGQPGALRPKCGSYSAFWVFCPFCPTHPSLMSSSLPQNPHPLLHRPALGDETPSASHPPHAQPKASISSRVVSLVL